MNKANWDLSDVTEGTLVTLTVKGTPACAGQDLTFEVRENDSLAEGVGDDQVSNNPGSATFVGNQAKATWVAEYQPDGFGGIFDPPEYFFWAGLSSDSSNRIRSEDPMLTVRKAAGPVPTPEPSPTPTPLATFPKITGVSGQKVAVGEQFTVFGNDFGTGGKVTIEGIEAPTIAWSPTSVNIIIPKMDPSGNAVIELIREDAKSDTTKVRIIWPSLTVHGLDKYFAYSGRETSIKIKGEGLMGFGNLANVIKVAINGTTLEATSTSNGEEITFTIPAGLPQGVYNITLQRADGESLPIAQATFVVTKPGDFWSPIASEGDLQVRDGKVTIEDLSRFLSAYWQSEGATSEGDINLGPGNVSEGKIDIYDLNTLMVNWDGQP